MSSIVEERNPGLKGLGTYEYGWSDSDAAGVSARRGLNDEVVRDISGRKNEPQWMLDLRLKGLKLFGKKPMPTPVVDSAAPTAGIRPGSCGQRDVRDPRQPKTDNGAASDGPRQCE